MADLAAALEVQWGEAHKRSGRMRLLLWGTLNSMPVLCWGPVSHPGITVHIAAPICMQHQHSSCHVHCANTLQLEPAGLVIGVRVSSACMQLWSHGKFRAALARISCKCQLAFAKGCSSNLIYLAHSSSDNLCRWVTFTGLSANQRLST